MYATVERWRCYRSGDKSPVYVGHREQIVTTRVCLQDLRYFQPSTLLLFCQEVNYGIVGCMEYASCHFRPNITEKIQRLIGEPIIVMERYDTCDAISARGTNQGGDEHAIVVEGLDGTSRSHPREQNSLCLVGYDEIDGYVESAFESYEQQGNLGDGLNAVSIARMFGDHYGEVPTEVCSELALAVINCPDRETLYNAALQLYEAPPQIADIVYDEIRRRLRASTRSYQVDQDALVSAFVAANADTGDISELRVIAELIG